MNYVYLPTYQSIYLFTYLSIYLSLYLYLENDSNPLSNHLAISN